MTMTTTTTTNHRRSTAARRVVATLAGIAFAGIASGVAVDAAAARPKPLVSYGGLGTHEAVAGGVRVRGSGEGDPFDGTFTGVLSPADGTLPAPGDCEPATATVRIDGPKGRYLVLSTEEDTGEVCGEWTDSVSRVTHVYTGRYVIEAATRRRFVGTDGWYEIRLADNGVAAVTAFDS